MEDWKKTLGKTFLLEGINPREQEELLEGMTPALCSYRRGETLCEPGTPPDGLFFLLGGTCDVVHEMRGERAVLNTLRKGECFGVLSLFSSREAYPTRVVARRETETMELSRADVLALIGRCPQVSINLMRFLTGRVEFLNDRLAELTEPTVERKLLRYLCGVAKNTGKRSFPVNRAHLSEQLCCGRASLYRAMDELCQQGLIRCEGKQVEIADREKLEGLL